MRQHFRLDIRTDISPDMISILKRCLISQVPVRRAMIRRGGTFGGEYGDRYAWMDLDLLEFRRCKGLLGHTFGYVISGRRRINKHAWWEHGHEVGTRGRAAFSDGRAGGCFTFCSCVRSFCEEWTQNKDELNRTNGVGRGIG